MRLVRRTISPIAVFNFRLVEAALQAASFCDCSIRARDRAGYDNKKSPQKGEMPNEAS
jgi:hypothetical protein